MFCKSTLRVLIFTGTNFCGFCGFWSVSRNILKVAIAKLLPAKKFRKAKILQFVHPWKTQKEIWFKQRENWSKYISYSSAIFFLAISLFDLGFCNISWMSLDLTSFFSCCFFLLLWFCFCLFPFFLLLKRKSQRFLRFLVQYKVCLAALHIELKVGGWQHFHSSLLSPHKNFKACLQPIPSSTTCCKQSTTKKSRLAKINNRKSFRKRTFVKISTRKM